MSFKRRFKRNGVMEPRPRDRHPDMTDDGNMWITMETGQPVRVEGNIRGLSTSLLVYDDLVGRIPVGRVAETDSAGNPVRWKYE